MAADKNLENELIQLRDALALLKNDTDKYSEQSQKSPTLLANLTKSLHQLQALTLSNEVVIPEVTCRKSRMAIK